MRAPQPGAPFAYVTTKKFLEVFGLATLRDLPDIEQLEDEGLLLRLQSETNLDCALGLSADDIDDIGELGLDTEFDDMADELHRSEPLRIRGV